jgi:hypothetical protein
MYFKYTNVKGDFIIKNHAFDSEDGAYITYIFEAGCITQVLAQFIYSQIECIENESPDHDAGGAGWLEGMVHPRIKLVNDFMVEFANGLCIVDLRDNDSRFEFIHLITKNSGHINWNVDEKKFLDKLKREIISATMDTPTLKLFNA